MALKVYNTLSRSLEPFEPLDSAGRQVDLYCCGPTVHDFAHIGNFRTFVFVDLFRRYLEFGGFEVRHVMNVTDVEDKIIRRVKEAGCSRAEYTARYEKAFFEDLETLGCRKPSDVPHATDHIEDIIELIGTLTERGIAYQAGDGSVYFSIRNYVEMGHAYGQLLNLNLDELRPGARVANDEYEKESVADFALWKARAGSDGEVFWPSPWGEGRPGWHIECSAMSMNLLGPSFDVHLGGEDLVFPHHEDEIAQSEGAGIQGEGKRFVKYWMHAAHLLVEGKKMSKSLGNFFTLRDLLDRGYSGREIRYLLMSAHYRETFNFTLDGLSGARTALGRIEECLFKLKEVAEGAGAEADTGILERFSSAMDDDLNVSAAWGVIFDWVRDLNRRIAAGDMAAPSAAAALAAWERLDGVLGVGATLVSEAPPEIQALAEERQAARKARDFARADAIRDELAQQGWVIEDTPKGPRIKRT